MINTKNKKEIDRLKKRIDKLEETVKEITIIMAERDEFMFGKNGLLANLNKGTYGKK